MRVSQETRLRTRQALLDAAKAHFARDGFEAARTREIASDAGIAAGTLFNYFPTKEALGLALAWEALAAAEAELEGQAREGASLEERLFAGVAVELRHLEPTRGWIGELLETALSPLRAEREDDAGAAWRRGHLERVAEGLQREPDLRERGAALALDLHLYWSLYLGVLGFWTRDDSPKQEDTLALLDRSIGLFCRALRES